jgi:hypothetical protein
MSDTLATKTFAAGTLRSWANAAAELRRKPGSATMFAVVRLVPVGAIATPKLSSTSGTGVVDGVELGVAVVLGVGVGDGERVTVAEGVVLGVAVLLGVTEGVGVPLGETVGVCVGVGEGVSVPVRLGVELADGVGDTLMQAACEPLPTRILPAGQTHVRLAPDEKGMKPGEHVHVLGEPRAVEPSGQAEHRSAVADEAFAPLETKKSFAQAQGSAPL